MILLFISERGIIRIITVKNANNNKLEMNDLIVKLQKENVCAQTEPIQINRWICLFQKYLSYVS